MKGWLLHPDDVDKIESEVKKLAVSEELLMPVNADKLSFMIEDNLKPRFWIDGTPVEPPDFALLWSGLSAYGLSVAEQLEAIGVICINPPSALYKTRSKIVAGRILAKAGIPVAKTIQLNNNTLPKIIAENLGFPLVVKPNIGFGGAGVNLLQSPEEYASFVNEHKSDIAEGRFIAQEYIATSKGRDLRVLAVDHKPVYAYIRQASDPDEFRSNLSVGGKSIPYELSDDLKELSTKITKVLDLSMAGIDYLFTEDGVIVGEVNAAPGYSGLSDPRILIKSLTAYVARQLLSRPAPDWKVNKLLEQAARTPLAHELLRLEHVELASIQSALFKRCNDVQETVLLEILNRCKDTAFGKEHGFGDIKSTAEYRRKMPLTEFGDYEQYAKRMENGESDLLFPGKAVAFYITSGTTAASKKIPESAEGQEARRLISRARNFNMLRLVELTEKSRVLSMASATVSATTAAGIPCGSASGQTVGFQDQEIKELLAFPSCLSEHYNGDELNYMILRCALPSENIIGIIGNNAARLAVISEFARNNAKRLIGDIREGSCATPIPTQIQDEVAPYLKADNARADFLDNLLAENRFIPKFYWPKLKAAGFWLGGTLGVYVDEVRRLLPDDIIYMDIGYGASELKINIPSKPDSPTGALATYCAYYEFIPENGGDPLPAHMVEDGGVYELVVTTYAGLYRYRMHDLVRVDGFTGNTPNICFVSKLGDIGSIEQEKLPGSVIAELAGKIVRKHGHVLIAVQAHTDTENRRYGVYIEMTEPESADVNQLAKDLEEALCREAGAYARARGRSLQPLVVNFMRVGWKEELFMKHKKGSDTITQVKLPVIISKSPAKEWIYV